MGILDDAIREHLDLKRKHGARETELREIEDEAFGAAEQPDPFTAGELLTEVGPAGAAQAEAALAEPGESEAGNEEPTRLVEPSALPPDDEALDLEADLELPEDPLSTPEGLTPVPGQEELPGQDQIPGQEDLLEQGPADEALDVEEPDAPSESLEDLIAEEEPFPEDVAAPPAPETTERPAPEGEPEEPEALVEPESAVPEPPPPPPDSGPEPPGRARGRVDVPTQEHPPPGDTGDLPPVGSEPEFRPEPFQPDEELPAEEGLAADEPFDPDEPLPPDQPLPPDEAESSSGAPALYDFETDEDPISGGGSGPATEDDAFDALGPAEEEAPYLEDEEPYPEEPASGTGSAPDEPSMGSGRQTFEEEEAEDLWFEKGPPQDFDFED
jgi:hypothetical protein